MEEIRLEKQIKTYKIINLLMENIVNNFEVNDFEKEDIKYHRFIKKFNFNFLTFTKLFSNMYNSCNYNTEILQHSYNFDSKMEKFSNKARSIFKENAEELVNFVNWIINSPLHNSKTLAKYLHYDYNQDKNNNSIRENKDNLLKIFVFESNKDSKMNLIGDEYLASNFYSHYSYNFIKLLMFMYQNENYTNTYISNVKLLDKSNKIGINYIKKNIQEKIDGLNKILKDLSNILELYQSTLKDSKNLNKSITKVKYFGKGSGDKSDKTDKSDKSDKSENSESLNIFSKAITEVMQEIKVKIYRLSLLKSKNDKSLFVH